MTMYDLHNAQPSAMQEGRPNLKLKLQLHLLFHSHTATRYFFGLHLIKVSDVVKRMVANDIGALAVTDPGSDVVTGIFSERDYLKKVRAP